MEGHPREEEAEIYFMPPIIKPTPEQVGFFTLQAAIFDDIFERGGMTAEEAAENRRLALFRIGMGHNMRPLPGA